MKNRRCLSGYGACVADKGAASTAFQNLHQRWNADARKLNTALGGISESLSGTHRRYSAAEESNTTAVNRVAGLIG